MPNVVTRFAPSPTGELHVGGARTALFNWLLARHHGGRYLLRIEDTDQARSTPESVESLMNDLAWLGYDHDNAGNVPTQAAKKPHYDGLIDDLKARGLAYDAFETKEELDEQRRVAALNKRPYLYARPSYTDDQLKRFADEGRASVVRFKMARQPWKFDDAVLGPNQGVDETQVQDFVIRKQDGMPTYHFAVVVDDADMDVTHVLRGQEHLLNSCQHVALMEALGYARPTFAHLPVILNDTSGAKLSKRDKDKVIKAKLRETLDAGGEVSGISAEAGLDEATVTKWLKDKRGQLAPDAQAKLLEPLGMTTLDLPDVNVADFRARGFLPETLSNFLALLGWSGGDDVERMSMDELVGKFSLDRIGVSNARFDTKKLTNFSTQDYEAALSGDLPRVVAAMRDYLTFHADSPLNGLDDGRLATLLTMNAGFHVLAEVDQKSRFFFTPAGEIDYDEKAVDKVLRKGDDAGFAALGEARAELAGLDEWGATSIEHAVRGLCQRPELGLGKVAQPLRVAVAGGSVSPPIFDTLAFLSKDEVLARIDRCLSLR